eukprot:1874365-Pyramimonas_sp.AAC.1
MRLRMVICCSQSNCIATNLRHLPMSVDMTAQCSEGRSWTCTLPGDALDHVQTSSKPSLRPLASSSSSSFSWGKTVSSRAVAHNPY